MKSWRIGVQLWQCQRQRGYAHAAPRSHRWGARWALLGVGAIGLGGWAWRESRKERSLLDPDWYVPLRLLEKEAISHDSFRLRLYTDPQPDVVFPVPSCVYIKDDTIQVMRPYTPINPDPYKDGYLDLVVKRYENGSISKMLSNVTMQGKVHVRGPIVDTFLYEPNTKHTIGMVAGGTGITPMFQVIRHVLENPEDHTKLWLLYANKQKEDILLHQELDALQAAHPQQFKIVYVLEHAPDDWNGQRGRVSKAMVEEMLQPDDKNGRMVLVSGPDGMLAHVCGQRARDYSQRRVTGILGQLGLSSDEVWKFQ